MGVCNACDRDGFASWCFHQIIMVFLQDHLRTAGVSDELASVILDLVQSSTEIRAANQKNEIGYSGTSNVFGDDQIKMDIISNDILEKVLRKNDKVASYASEETDTVIELSSSGKYCVVFDPLDGSSLFDVNFAIGSIFGIYAGNDFIGKTAREQVAAFYILYGPRTTLVYSVGKGSHEFTIDEKGEAVLLRENLTIAEKGKNFGPGNLTGDNQKFMALAQKWIESGKTIRYSGAMVADAHHVLSKGQGVFMNVGNAKYPNGKLRLPFECGPFAYLIEQAGGASSDGTNSILDAVIEKQDQRIQFIAGSKGDVEEAVASLS